MTDLHPTIAAVTDRITRRSAPRRAAYLDLMQAWRRPVYFDQHGRLTRQFGVTQVPALVSQDGARLRIDELETTQ